MLIKFHSEESADFVMLASAAEQLLAMMGHGGSTEGSVSGDALARALDRLDTAVAREPDKPAGENVDEPEGVRDSDEDEDNEEPEAVTLSARAAPLIAMLRRANKAEGYVMWRKD
jgi:hypothetical protein